MSRNIDRMGPPPVSPWLLTAIALLGWACPSAALDMAPRFDFGPEIRVPTGRSIAGIGDLDGDGSGDVLLSSWSGSDAVIVSVAADGSLVTRSTPGVAGYGVPAIGDLDGDGDLDVAAPQAGPVPGLRVFLNDGHGNFSLGAVLDAGPSPWRALCADFDGDGVTDIVVASRDSAVVTLIRGTGGGVFAPGRGLPVNGACYLMCSGDVDGDGLPDLVLADGPCTALSILQGSRSECLRQTFGAIIGGYFEDVALGDLDGDGRADLVLAMEWPRVGVRIMRAAPGARFEDWAEFPTDDREVFATAVIDLDGDGRNDVAFSSNGPLGACPLGVLWNRPEGWDRESKTPLYSGTPVEFITGRVGPDPQPQLVALDTDNRTGQWANVSLLAPQSRGRFARRVGYDVTAPSQLFVTHRRHHGSPEILTGADSIRVLTALPGGTFDRPVTVAAGAIAAVVDLDHDGSDEWLVSRGDTLVALDPDPRGSVRERWTIPGFGRFGAIGHFTTNKRLELISSTGIPRIWMLSSAGRPGEPVAHPELGVGGSYYGRGFAEGDPYGDGNPVLLEAKVGETACGQYGCSTTPDVLIRWQADGSGRFVVASADTFPVAPEGWSVHPFTPASLISVDLDGDGRRDAVVTTFGGELMTGLAMLRQRPDGRYESMWWRVAWQTVYQVTTADFDGDGRVDVAAAGAGWDHDWSETGELTIFHQTAEGTFHPDTVGMAVNGTHWVVAGDWDDDGRPDLAYSSNLGLVTVVMNATPLVPKRHPPRAALDTARVAPSAAAVRFALERVAPNPAVGAVRLSYAVLPGEPASLELIDIAGRRVWSREIAAGSGGASSFTLEMTRALPPGLYFARLRQGDRSAITRVTLLR